MSSEKQYTINDLGLVDEEFTAAVKLTELPEQFAATYELPQPGVKYLFRLPAAIGYAPWPDGPWEKVETSTQGQKIKATFRFNKDTGYDGRLTLIGAPYDGKKVSLSLSNVLLGKASKLDYLLAALNYTGSLIKNSDYVETLAAEGGAKFRAVVTYTASNQGTKQKYSSRPYTSKKTGVEVKPIPRDHTGRYAQEFVDESGQLLRCFIDLEDFSKE